MTKQIRAVVTVPHPTLLPRDWIVNTWAFSQSDDDLEAAGDNIAAGLDAFYEEVISWLSSEYSWDASTLELIDMTDPRPRFPFRSQGLGISGEITTGNDFPAEVALCLSFKADSVSGQRPARRRGRVYVGPLQITGTDAVVPSTTLVNTVINGAAALVAALGTTDWCVYSRYTHYGVPVGARIDDKDANGDRVYDEVPANLSASFAPVTSWWVDNAFDIQRRRGPGASSRTTGP